MIDKKYTYFLIEDFDGNIFKCPLEVLGDILIMDDEENQKIRNTIDTIDELSAYLLNLSAEFVKEHYSLEELSSNFEMISETDALLTDKTILNEEDVYKFINDRNIILVSDVDSAYDGEEVDADKVFDKIDNESDNYF